jgi:thioesterase domain-containing protein/acyl carrier protein
MYGPTETTIWSTTERITSASKPISIGRPIANTNVYVLDKSLKAVPPGVSGELFIGGDGVARGYRHRADLTPEKFIPDPFSTIPGARLYRTGDLARCLPDGRLMHLGRIDQQVKIRGFRIELGEIESVLSRHPDIAQIVVAAKDDTAGSRQLVAYLIARTAERPDPSALRTLLRASLPEYMVPSHFIFMDAFPQTANRKVNVAALPSPSAIPAQAETPPQQTQPRGRLEVQLTVLWRQVLGDETVGVHDNFFDRGGHSLKAVQLLSFLEQVTGRSFPLATLFQAPTVAGMAQLLTRSNWQPSWRSLVAIQPTGRLPPVFAIPGVGGNVLMFARLSKLLGNDRPFYGLQARGLDNAEKPFTSIPKMAAHYVSEIRSVRPKGPFIIAGTCTGGVIAYEVAHQLLKQGEAVQLILLDTWHPRSARRTHHGSPLLWPVRFLWLKAFAYTSALARRPFSEWPDFFKRKAQIARAMAARSIQDTLAISGFTSGRVVEATWKAVAAYMPPPLPGPLLNIIADEDPVPPEIDTRRLWEPLARGGSETIFIHAKNSGRLFMAPWVTELAAHLSQRLTAETGDVRRQ